MGSLDGSVYYNRQRINSLLTSAVKNRLVVICAVAGCGKTIAVSSFVKHKGIPAIWMQISERDNLASRFWDSFVNAARQLDNSFAAEIKDLGFPDTTDKENQFLDLLTGMMADRPCLFVLDDLHLVDEPSLLGLVERIIYGLPEYSTMILICRNLPKINITSMQVQGLVSIINEDALSFTESELIQYISQHNLSLERQSIREILLDTNGWAFSINFIVHALKNSPGYLGYVRNAMKQNLHHLMEKEVWQGLSEGLKQFLAKLSLIDHLSADLVTVLSANDTSLLDELNRQNAYIRFDSSMDAF
jgi:LuxR family maltose regulon positive regulatory protein